MDLTALPVTTFAASAIVSGQVALARGGTNADLSATGGTGQVLQQSTAGGAITVGQLASSSLSDASNVPLLNAANVFTAVQTVPQSSSNNASLKIASVTAGVGYSNAFLTLVNGSDTVGIKNGIFQLYNTAVFNWTSGAVSGTADVGFARSAAGVVKVTNGSTGYGSVSFSTAYDNSSSIFLANGIVGFGTSSRFRFFNSSNVFAATADDLNFRRSAVGVFQIDDGDGGNDVTLRLARKSSTTNRREVADFVASFPTLTDATRLGRLEGYVYDYNAARKWLEVNATGSAAQVGIGGAVSGSNLLTVNGSALIGSTTIISGRVQTQYFTDPNNSKAYFNTGVTGVGFQLVNQIAGNVPFQIQLPASQSADILQVNSNGGSGGDVFKLTSAGRIVAPGCPTYADNAAAIAGGLATNTVYKTSTGELRIVV